MYNTPILLICFKRYEKTLEIFNAIKSVEPKKLYVSIDGASNKEEKKQIDKVVSIFDGIDWDCDLNINRSDRNQGCKYGVYNAISWFFEHEEYGIIIEDDVLPYPQFFPYCEELLEKYKDDKRIGCISAWSYFYDKEPADYPYTYYFSHIQSSWGWATWKDRWDKMDLELKNTSFEDIEKNLRNDKLPESIIQYYKWVYNTRLSFDSTWDYQFMFSVLMKNNMYCIQPIRRFVKNIGDVDGTHPTDKDHNKSLPINDDFVMNNPPQFNYDLSMDIMRNHQTNEYIKEKMNINFITFANTDSNFSQERIIFEAKRMDIFNDITFYTEKDFDEEFMDRCGKEFPNFRRGYGYWSWKPYIIKKELEKVDYGDVVVYADSGCMFKRKNRKVLKEWINIVKNSESGVLSPCFGPYIEHDWTRADLYDYIDKAYNKNHVDIFDKAIQCGCGISLYMKNEKCVDFVNQWYDVMTNHFHLCTDEPSTIPNHPNFREHRHDQSVFSMLSKIYNIETIETSKGILDRKNSPIIATRCKSDKNTWKKPIDVLFDSQIYDLQKFGGISRMYSDIANELNRNEIVERYTGNGITNGKYQDYYVRFSVGNTNNAYIKDVYCDKESPENYKVSVDELERGDFDIFYPTFFSPYFLKHLGNKPFVMSVHDMIPEIYSEFFSRGDLQILGKKQMVRYASAIEVPSECTKKDLVRTLNVDENKIHVVGRAISPDFGKNVLSKSAVDFEYILYVGQRNKYKRFDWFIKHIVSFMNAHSDIHIICTGNEFNEKEKKLLKKYGILDRVHTVFADDVLIATLYKYAKFFVFSSEYEGFGLPILESYKMDCIALLNDIEVFREVTDGNGTFFTLHENESNLSEIAEKILLLTEDERKKIIDTQHRILEKYSFEKYINNFKEMFNEVVEKMRSNTVTSGKDQTDKLDIYICTHKDFESIVSNPCYKVINANDINGDIAENGLKGSFYSEFYSYSYIAKNYPLKDYIGFCHYRKYFSFMDDIPDMDEAFSRNDIIIAKPLAQYPTVREAYKRFHNIEDLEIVRDIMKDKFNDYLEAYDICLDSRIMIPYNMFIMKKDDFIKYVDFVEGVLNEYLNVVGTDIEKRINDNKDKYIKAFKPNSSLEYQYRIGGYLAERLTNVFIYKHFKKVRFYSVIITEKKYSIERWK